VPCEGCLLLAQRRAVCITFAPLLFISIIVLSCSWRGDHVRRNYGTPRRVSRAAAPSHFWKGPTNARTDSVVQAHHALRPQDFPATATAPCMAHMPAELRTSTTTKISQAFDEMLVPAATLSQLRENCEYLGIRPAMHAAIAADSLARSASAAVRHGGIPSASLAAAAGGSALAVPQSAWTQARSAVRICLRRWLGYGAVALMIAIRLIVWRRGSFIHSSERMNDPLLAGSMSGYTSHSLRRHAVAAFACAAHLSCIDGHSHEGRVLEAKGVHPAGGSLASEWRPGRRESQTELFPS
jgi:hypothetical protein